MLVIRLRRIGKKNKPSYRVVVAENSMPLDGKFVQDLGFYNPHTKNVKIEETAAKTWMDKGAQPSNTVAKLLEGLKVKHKSVVVVKRNKKPKAEVEKIAKKATATLTPIEEVATEETTEAPTEIAEAPTPEPTPETPAKEATPEASETPETTEA